MSWWDEGDVHLAYLFGVPRDPHGCKLSTSRRLYPSVTMSERQCRWYFATKSPTAVIKWKYYRPTYPFLQHCFASWHLDILQLSICNNVATADIFRFLCTLQLTFTAAELFDESEHVVGTSGDEKCWLCHSCRRLWQKCLFGNVDMEIVSITYFGLNACLIGFSKAFVQFCGPKHGISWKRWIVYTWNK